MRWRARTVETSLESLEVDSLALPSQEARDAFRSVMAGVSCAFALSMRLTTSGSHDGVQR